MNNIFFNFYKFIKTKKNFFFIFLIILLTFYRSPFILINGRFVAEEGYIWFRNIFLFGNFDTLIFVHEFSGYLNLWMNIAAILAAIPPIEFAPLATVYFALLLKIYIFFYIIFSNSSLLPNIQSKYIGCIIVLFSPVMTPEIWLTSLFSINYLGILVFLMLFEKNKNSHFKKINPYVLLISGLSGLYGCVLAPLFYIKYFFSKNKSNLLNFIVISLCSFAQLLIIIYTKIFNLIAEDRFFITYEKIINFIYNAILKVFFGREILQKIIFITNFNLGKILALVFVFFLFLIVFLILLKKKDYILNMIAASFAIETLLVLFGAAYKDFAGGRYAVVPGVIISFMILRLFFLFKEAIYKGIFFIILLISLVVGFLEFKYFTIYPTFLSCINCPVWKEEIIKWKKDNHYIINIWNYPHQQLKLY